MTKGTNYNYDFYLTTAFGSRFKKLLTHPITGWIKIENRSIIDPLWVHFEPNVPNSQYSVIAPRSARWYQCENSDMWDISIATSGSRAFVEYSKFKPSEQIYQDFPEVENGELSTTISATTTLDCTTLSKGYGTHFDCSVADGAGIYTVEISRDGGSTYGPTIDLNHTDPNLSNFGENKLFTHLRFTKTADDLTYYVS